MNADESDIPNQAWVVDQCIDIDSFDISIKEEARFVIPLHDRGIIALIPVFREKSDALHFARVINANVHAFDEFLPPTDCNKDIRGL